MPNPKNENKSERRFSKGLNSPLRPNISKLKEGFFVSEIIKGKIAAMPAKIDAKMYLLSAKRIVFLTMYLI